MTWWKSESNDLASMRSERLRGDAVARTMAMVDDQSAIKRLGKRGLTILDVTWEDTGRSKGSCYGPNISDMTIQVQSENRAGHPEFQSMPVIRVPNFKDKTGDIRLDRFSVMVGNEKGDELRPVPLRSLLTNLRSYLHDPDSWPGAADSVLAPERDSHVLVSPQACFLPIKEGGKASFNPALFNYQSSAGAPAVLTILATREGTSITIIDNNRDLISGGGARGQRLFFNQNGERAAFTGERKSDFMAAANANADGSNDQDRDGMNLVMLIQVPLKVTRHRTDLVCFGDVSTPLAGVASRGRSSGDVEEAVIGHGEVEGPFTEIDGIRIERDPSFPIRATVQFYQATGDGVLSDEDVHRFATQIERVYRDADYVGSLVVDKQNHRPTDSTGQYNLIR